MTLNPTIARHAQRALIISLAAMALGLAQTPAEAAPTRFALTCIGTETGGTINFEYRWGSSGAWTSSSVSAGKWRPIIHTYDYPGENRSPTLEIRYDDDYSSGINRVVTKLKSYAASSLKCEAQGYTYNFRNRSGEIYVTDEEGGADEESL